MLTLKAPLIIQTKHIIRRDVLFGWFYRDVPLPFSEFSYSPTQLFSGMVRLEGIYGIAASGEIIYNPFGIDLSKPFFYLPSGEYLNPEECRTLNGKIQPVLKRRLYPIGVAFPAGDKFATSRASKQQGTFNIYTLLEDLNGELVEVDEDGNYVVRWIYDSQAITSIVSQEGNVIEAGYCVSGNDRAMHAFMLKAVREKWDDVSMDDDIHGVISP